MSESKSIPLQGYIEYSHEEMQQRAADFNNLMQRRRSVRDFSPRSAPRQIIEDCLLAAGSAPNGANMQPWHFVVVSDPEVKSEIRKGAEIEERKFYEERASDEWKDALSPLETNWQKPFLEVAPYLIVIFSQSFGVTPEGERVTNYYVQESVGIATGMLITAVHNAGLVSLTHTPSPMGFLNDILKRPSNERPFLILVVGYPVENVNVPDISRKPLKGIATFI